MPWRKIYFYGPEDPELTSTEDDNETGIPDEIYDPTPRTTDN